MSEEKEKTFLLRKVEDLARLIISPEKVPAFFLERCGLPKDESRIIGSILLAFVPIPQSKWVGVVKALSNAIITSKAENDLLFNKVSQQALASLAFSKTGNPWWDIAEQMINGRNNELVNELIENQIDLKSQKIFGILMFAQMQLPLKKHNWAIKMLLDQLKDKLISDEIAVAMALAFNNLDVWDKVKTIELVDDILNQNIQKIINSK